LCVYNTDARDGIGQPIGWQGKGGLTALVQLLATRLQCGPACRLDPAVRRTSSLYERWDLRMQRSRFVRSFEDVYV